VPEKMSGRGEDLYRQGMLLRNMDCITCHESHPMIPHNRLNYTIIQPIKKFPACIESIGSRFSVTEVLNWTLSLATSVNFLLSHTISLKFILLLSFNFLPDQHVTWRFPDQKPVCLLFFRYRTASDMRFTAGFEYIFVAFVIIFCSAYYVMYMKRG
jgi:hypothetical protein